jgi:hypothetical protein
LGKTLYWVLLFVYVGPQATHFTGYCCWFIASGNTLLGIAVGLCMLCGTSANTIYWVLLLVMLRLGQHTLLAIVLGVRGASDNTLYWVLLWVMQGFGQHTLLDIIGLMWGAFINGFKIILF